MNGALHEPLLFFQLSAQGDIEQLTWVYVYHTVPLPLVCR